MTMTRSRRFPITFDIPENSPTSLTIEPNDAGGFPVLIFEREDGELEVFNWQAQAYQPIDWVDVA